MDEAVSRVNGLSVTLWRSPAPGDVQELVVHLQPYATVLDALNAVGWLPYDGLCGVWGRVCSLDQALSPGDRVELYRPLKIDPKLARRERFQRQGARGAGLFAVRRPNSKAGY